MNHQDHVNLLRAAVARPGGQWADFGSGDGAFTLALRELVGADAEIFSVDKDAGRLDAQRRNFRVQFPQSNIHFIRGDFSRPLDLTPLDGIVMANALHYFRDKESVLRHVRAYLKANGRFVLVEYNVDSGNPWVPHPLSFETFRHVAVASGLTEPQLLATIPSRFLREIYSALAFKNGIE
jgi:ubiquinone/menaquinone biosynthesis C-methylase UbiE